MSIKSSIIKPLSPQLIGEINQYLLIKTEILPADLCLLFGSQRSIEARVRETASLWQQRLFKLVVVSGGQIGQTKVAEADLIAEKLVDAGVPLDKILVENKARNTGENVEFTIRILRGLCLLNSIKSVIAVGRLSSSRRYLMTLQRHWPSVTKMLAPVNCHPVDPSLWYTNVSLVEEILSEWRKLAPYLKAGFLEELDPKSCPLI